MIRKYVKNSLYLFLTGGIALSIIKDEKIMDYSANFVEKYSSRYVSNHKNEYSIEGEKSNLKSLVNSL